MERGDGAVSPLYYPNLSRLKIEPNQWIMGLLHAKKYLETLHAECHETPLGVSNEREDANSI